MITALSGGLFFAPNADIDNFVCSLEGLRTKGRAKDGTFKSR